MLPNLENLLEIYPVALQLFKQMNLVDICNLNRVLNYKCSTLNQFVRRQPIRFDLYFEPDVIYCDDKTFYVKIKNTITAMRVVCN
jgi:hypothetical protein